MQFRNSCNPLINHEEWTEEEKMKLQEVVRLHQEHDWCSIAEAVGNHRTPLQCLQTYQVISLLLSSLSLETMSLFSGPIEQEDDQHNGMDCRRRSNS